MTSDLIGMLVLGFLLGVGCTVKWVNWMLDKAGLPR